MALITFRTTAATLILCSFLTSALCCDWLDHYNDLRNRTLVLVRTMGGPFTTTTHPRFPDRLYSLYKEMKSREENSQLHFIRDSLVQIYNLYRHDDMSAAGWDAVKTTNFLESINRQIVELNQCVNETTSNQYVVYEKRLKHYYRRLKKTLLRSGDKNGWETLRRETEQNLNRLELLGNQIKASRGQH